MYIWLLIFEGSLRKWLLPQFSDVLLIIRDPVVLVIYALAIKARIFPTNRYIISLAIISALSWAVSILVLSPFLNVKSLVLVTGFGFRSNFLHLPLIFVIGNALTTEDMKKLGWWFLVGMIPMALLLAVQFAAAPEAFINRTAGLGESLQITAGGGKIRPPGTFSFVSGVIFYSALATAFLLYGALTRQLYRSWVLYSAGCALVIAIGVSGSRSVLLSVLLVVASLIAVILIRPSAINQFGRNLLIGCIALLVASRLPVFNEGVQVLSDRFTETAAAEDKTIASGLILRTLDSFTGGLSLVSRAPMAGYGLGIGTNGGARFLTGRATFLLTEGEWGRVILESGPILGLAFLLWRVFLTFTLGFISFRQLKRGAILPIMLFCAGAVSLLNGQFGQPTNLGFTVLICGLCLAAASDSALAVESGGAPPPVSPPPRRIARRSSYAERLHSAPAQPSRVHDGPTDR